MDSPPSVICTILSALRGVDKVIVSDEFFAQLDTGMSISITEILPGLGAVCLCMCCVVFQHCFDTFHR